MAKKTQRTRDGLNIQKVVRKIGENFSDLGVKIRESSRHLYSITYQGMFPCALGESTNVRQHIVPFLNRIPNMEYSSNEIYRMIRG
jgi:hypothetical protein